MMQDVSILLQALPYLNEYQGKTFVLKVGGELVEDPDNLASLAQDITFINKVGIRVLLIHGGGPQASQLSERLGLKPTFVAGRRVTDRDTLEVAKMIFAGKINTEILSSLRRFGGRAVGLSGVDAGVVRAVKRPIRRMKDPETGLEQDVDFGEVGDVEAIDATLLRTLLDHDYIPVLSSLGADENGRVYNINADTVAAEIAKALRADKLLILTNVPGLLSRPDSKQVIPSLTLLEARRMMEDGRVTKGMLPKLASAVGAVKGGVGKATILSGLVPHSLLEETFTNRGSGTLVTRGKKATKPAKKKKKKRAGSPT